MLYAIRIIDAFGGFHGYLSHKGRKAWSRRQAQRHAAESKTLSHFAGMSFIIEAD